ncbi:SPFH domain-containing protein [Paraburkholderia sp. GAS32]|uniref:SPFH domain-containing protein n=1 Tax=Paraburkholderia sp. GAS32 TaxID=3035129 RepID=UPI003D251D0E
MDLTIIASAVGAAFVALSGITAVRLRRVVPTNMVHIVQTTKSSKPYGRGKPAGNTYYAFPTWVPVLGITVTAFPESIFQVRLESYLAYDSATVPFKITAVAFFQIQDAETAAQRVATFQALTDDLASVMQGSVRRVLATNSLEHIMRARGELSEAFTKEVKEQVGQWGVTTVKSIEFMDVHDADGYTVIENMKAKEVSRIDMDSRKTVAQNKQEAQSAEIAAAQAVALKQQESEQQIGKSKAETAKQIGLAEQTAQQEIGAAKKTTAEREMEVQRVNEVQGAQIRAEVATVEANKEKAIAIIQAEQNKETASVNADAKKTAQITEAEGALSAAEKEAQGTRAKGEAAAAAQEAMLMAPVNAQITLAEKIGQDEGYQRYLIGVKQIEAGQAVGLEMARAMQKAELKVIANAGDVQSGIAHLGDAFSSKGGMNLTGMLATLGATDVGKAFLNRLTGTPNTPAVVAAAAEPAEATVE